MTEWKDATSYSQGELLRGAQPRSWSITSGPVRIFVTKAHLHNPDEWVMHCHALGMNTVSTGLPSDAAPELAQRAAITMAAKIATEFARIVRSLS